MLPFLAGFGFAAIGVVAIFAIGFLVGSVPFGLILSHLAGLGDIRAIGSGNIGATNVLRTGRKDIAAATLLLDGGKGVVAVLLSSLLAIELQHAQVFVVSSNLPIVRLLVGSLFLPGGSPFFLAILLGIGAVYGHCKSPWVGFRGGKGVATGIGVILAWAWPVGLLTCLLWLLGALVFKRSSLAAVIAFVAAPLLMLTLVSKEMALATFFVSELVIVRHKANIRRLLAGTEPRIGAK